MATNADAVATVRRVAWRVFRAAELLGLAVGLFFCFVRLPCAAAAVSSLIRFAASFAVRQSVFVVVNGIVIVLVVLCLRDHDGSAPFSPGALLGWWPSDGDAQGRCLPFPGPPLTLPPPPPQTTAAAEAEEEAVFEDKEAVHVTTVRAQPRRRTMSEKAGESTAAAAAVPELRRAKSENGRQHQLAAEPEPEPEPEVVPAVAVEWWMGDEEAFRLSIDAFILRQQKLFQREEENAAAGKPEGGASVAAAGAVVAVK